MVRPSTSAPKSSRFEYLVSTDGWSQHSRIVFRRAKRLKRIGTAEMGSGTTPDLACTSSAPKQPREGRNDRSFGFGNVAYIHGEEAAMWCPGHWQRQAGAALVAAKSRH